MRLRSITQLIKNQMIGKLSLQHDGEIATAKVLENASDLKIAAVVLVYKTYLVWNKTRKASSNTVLLLSSFELPRVTNR